MDKPTLTDKYQETYKLYQSGKTLEEVGEALNKQLTVGSLFSGIGGIDLGMQRAGCKIIWQVEIDSYCRKVLQKHWPEVPKYEDITTLSTDGLERPDILIGGFPCQDISDAGKQVGIDGERSGLWTHFYRIICELRPRYVVVENVAALLHRGMGRVLGDLAAGGYDAEWQILSAESVGAPHLRERVFIVAHTQIVGRRSWRAKPAGQFWQTGTHGNGAQISYAHSDRCWNGALQQESGTECEASAITGNNGAQGADAYTDFQGLEVRPCFGRDARQKLAAFERDCSTGTGQWAVEPGVVRVVHGIPYRMDRIRGLGNAVVPQVAEYVGRCIVAAEAERQAVA